MDKVVKAIAPNMPEDRHVKGTRDVMTWYKIVKSTKTLLVPPMNVLKTNMRELERFSEAVQAFAVADLDGSEYRWGDEDLVLDEVTGAEPEKLCEALKRLPDLARQFDGWIACDIETRRVEWEDNMLLSIGFAYGPSHCLAVYDIPIPGAKHSDCCDAEEWGSRVWNCLERVLAEPDIKYIWHNGKFDCGRLKYLCNLDAHVDDDTMLQHFACINEKQGTHGLKDLGQLYLQAPAWDDELDSIKRDWCKQRKVPLKEFMYDYIPTKTLIPYMQRDCIATYRLHALFNKLARPGSEFIYKQLCRASTAYGAIELAGQQIDVDYLEELEAELDKLVVESQKRLDRVSGKYWNPLLYAAATGAKVKPDMAFSPKSPKQLKWMLGEVMGHPVPATDATTMQTLMDELDAMGEEADPDAKEFMESILAVRKYSKYLETYVLGIRDVLCRDNRVRCTFNLHGTETGRLSSSNPNMQNIPRNKMIKNLIVSSPGTRFLQLDYSQAELRVLAMLSGDPALINIYVSGRDLHDAVCDMMFGEGSHKDKELRNLAKTINFGIAYGRGAGSIATKFKKSMREAQDIIDKWFAPMPKVKEFINNRRRMATRGEPCVTIFGRERHFVITDAELNHIQNEYINTPIQGTASDFTMLSLLNIYDYLQENWAGKARIVSTVHDSIIIEVEDKPEYLKEIGNKCINIMATTPLQFVPDCPVPFVADAEIGYKWGEMYKLDLETGLAKPKD